MIEQLVEMKRRANTIASITGYKRSARVLLDNQHGLFGAFEYNSFQCNLVNPFMKEELILRSVTWVLFICIRRLGHVPHSTRS